MRERLSIIIPAAGQGTRAKDGPPKALLELPGGETVLARQLRLLRVVFPRADIVVVVGHRGREIVSTLPRRTRHVWNKDFSTTNVAYSISLALDSCGGGPALVVYGDLVFSSGAIPRSLMYADSTIVLTGPDVHRQGEVGAIVQEGELRNLSYGLPDKWGQILLLRGKERKLYEELTADPARWRHFTFEVINEMIDYGAVISPIWPNAVIREIDRPADIPRANSLVLSEKHIDNLITPR